MIHYHGGPIWPVETAEVVWRQHHAFVSFARPEQITLAARVCQSFALDNGAFSHWKKGGRVSVKEYVAWVDEWRQHPAFDWCLVPDAIDGDEAENDRLFAEFREAGGDLLGSVPVWHMHESLERLVRLGHTFARVALGSSGAWKRPGTKPWQNRMAKAMDALCDANGRPPCKLHGLLDRAFEEVGCSVVRGPDLLWGGDVHRFSIPAPGLFDGIIGGPPCQLFSTASMIAGTDAVDLIPEFLRLVSEGAPKWVVMENVRGTLAHPQIPRSWYPLILRDWDCGGATARVRAFFTWPFMVMAPGRRPGDPSPSVMATTWKRGKGSSRYVADKSFLPGDLPLEEYGRLQGAPDVVERLKQHHSSKAFAVHVLGNGVPLAMGRVVARATAEAMWDAKLEEVPA